jgi:DNA end-binding protein Ku
VHVPVSLHTATRESGIDFDWLDKRSMDPVGYKRINKRTGKEIERDHIVKGIKQDDDTYVILSEQEIADAYPRTTQTIAIESFAHAAEIPFFTLEKPYFLEPIGRGEKVYMLLRDAMRDAGVIGIARVVMHSKEHLAVLVPAGPALMLNTIRWAHELLPGEDLHFPPEGSAKTGVKPAELKMATQLIKEMTRKYDPNDYADTFTDAVHALVKKKIQAGETKEVKPLEDAPEKTGSGNVVDLTELLARSLQKKPRAPTPAAPAKSATPTRAARKSTRKRA